MTIRVIESGIDEPVSLEELRVQCRIDDDVTEENSLLKMYLIAAREYCEEHTGRHFAAKDLSFNGQLKDRKPLELDPDLIAVSVIRYLDSHGVTKNLDPDQFFVSTYREYGAVFPLLAWPAVQSNHPSPVNILFKAGYEECPKLVKQAILLLASTWYENREITTNKTTLEAVGMLLRGFRLVKI